MTITLRTNKGSELTYAELDGNFTDLDTRVLAIEADSVDSRLISLEGGNFQSRITALELDSADGRLLVLEGQTLDTRISTLEGQTLDTRVSNIEAQQLNDSAEVINTIAGLSVGAIGTYGLFYDNSVSGGSPGGTVPGSSLIWSNSGGDFKSGNPSGTWMRMGYVDSGDPEDMVTLFLRIS
jgi:hypothetical protein